VRPTAKSLILDLLSTLGRKSAPVRALVEAAGLFGIEGNNVRVTLARLLADGLVDRDERGLYRPGPGASAVNDQIRSWRRLEERLRRWDGGWVGVHTGGLVRGDAGRRRRRERALRFLGFRTLAPGLELRPDNLAGGVTAVRQQLSGLGLEPGAPVLRLSELDATTEQRARDLWDAAALATSYRDWVARIEASAERLPRLPRGEAMVESFTLGGDAIRQLVLDPLLPEPIVPARERRALVSAMRRYDALGRRIWTGWLGDDAKSRPDTSPAGVRGLAAAQDVLRAAGGI
jgi:phenylacetic acid degradation operon negative regulatory protein